jgi:hypothetical protein
MSADATNQKFWLFVFLLQLLSAFTGAVIGVKWSTKHTVLAEQVDYTEEFHAIREQLTNMASSRCMNVNTPTLTVSVYSTENLSVKKVPPPPKKEIADARPTP